MKNKIMREGADSAEAFKATPRLNPSLVLDFWSRCEKGDGCWEWTGSKGSRGYGRYYVDGSYHAAHRIAYVLAHGSIPDGLTIDHLCRNRACVKPAHLEAVSAIENARRGNSPPALNARKTLCQRGHEFTPENTYVTPRGNRECRACKTAQPMRTARVAREHGRCVNCQTPSETYRCQKCREIHNAIDRRRRQRVS